MGKYYRNRRTQPARLSKAVFMRLDDGLYARLVAAAESRKMSLAATSEKLLDQVLPGAQPQPHADGMEVRLT